MLYSKKEQQRVCLMEETVQKISWGLAVTGESTYSKYNDTLGHLNHTKSLGTKPNKQ